MKYSIVLFISIILSCNAQRSNKEFQAKVNYTGAPTIVYKTKKDYSKLVPILLNTNKDSIVFYPAKSDLQINETFAFPTILHKGYLLDNRGIGVNVAFLKYTYQEYCNLSELPSESELIASIIDKDPLTEIYNLGSRYQYNNLLDSLNSIIDSDKLKLHKKLN